MYTHFSSADTDAAYTRQQQTRFDDVVAYARTVGVGCMVHAANSAAFLKQKHFCCNAVRPGISLYGLSPYEGAGAKIKLAPVLSWKTHIVFLKRVPRQSGISYGKTYVTRKLSVIATLPVGYADGYNRLLSNKASVLVRGIRCPVVGRVTMDMIMVDVTAVPSVSIGDEAVLIGRQGKNCITVEEIARQIGTISYEVTCAISARVPRILI
jgi:alanine racemase